MRRFRNTSLLFFVWLGFQLVVFDSKAQWRDDFTRQLFGADIFREYLSIDIVNNRFVGETNGVRQFWKLSGVNVSLLFQYDITGSDLFYVASGIRYSHNRFKNTGWFNTDISGEMRTSVFENLPDSVVRQNSRFVASYIELPVEFRIREQDMEWFGATRFTLGCVLGYNVFSFEHWVQGGSRYKEYNFAELNKFRFGIYARFGRRFWGIYAGYYFTPLFANPGSSKLNILNFGLNIAI